MKLSERQKRLDKSIQKINGKINTLQRHRDLAIAKVVKIKDEIKRINTKNKVHQIKEGRWYRAIDNDNIWVKIIKRSFDNINIFLVNMDNDYPYFTTIHLSNGQFFGFYKKCNNPYDEVVKRLKEVM